ncbi:YitT family protein [Streptomyces sp. NPDC059063]|uniref:membrane protein YczE n=1 Tax=unclassified Streptomyces TaxID=2593676 RepID=UPI00368AD6BF
MTSRHLGGRRTPTTARRASAPPLAYVPLGERPLRRLPQLLLGLALYGFSIAVLIRASLGANPWSVLHEGVARRTPLSFGGANAVLGVLVLLLWIPLRQRPRLGTVANVVVVAVMSDVGLALVPAYQDLLVRAGLLGGAVVLNGLSVAVYVGARLGPGPRDGLMTGAAEVTGRSLRFVRTLIELTVLAAGWLLGGTVGAGTVLYAVAVGPVTQVFVARAAYRGVGEAPVRDTPSPARDTPSPARGASSPPRDTHPSPRTRPFRRNRMKRL